MATTNCPRCGYDQSGIIATWDSADACPLEGTCSECGLTILWRDLLNPQWTLPRWSFEHRAGWWQVGVHLRTCCAALRPWSFWTRMTMHFPIVRSRLLRHAAAALLASHLVIALGAARFAHHTAQTWTLTPSGAFYPATTSQMAVAQIQAALDAFVWPYGYVRLAAPRNTWASLPEVPVWLAHGHLWTCLTPAAFFILTQSLRRIPVRRRHLLRGWAYGLTPLPLVAGLWLIVDAPATGVFVGGPGPAPANNTMSSWLVAAMAAWQLLYWSMFARRYLALPHPWAVAVGMLAIGGLAAGVLIVLARIQLMLWAT